MSVFSTAEQPIRNYKTLESECGRLVVRSRHQTINRRQVSSLLNLQSNGQILRQTSLKFPNQRPATHCSHLSVYRLEKFRGGPHRSSNLLQDTLLQQVR